MSSADCLLTLSDLAPKLQNMISLLCEEWWLLGMRDREEVVPNTVLYLLARALSQGAKVRCVFFLAAVHAKSGCQGVFWSRLLDGQGGKG